MNAPLVEWAHVTKEDCDGLAHFTCTDPPKPFKDPTRGYQRWHPRNHEFEAQQTVRGLAKRIPPRLGVQTWRLRDAEGVVGVASWEELDGPGLVHLDVLAIAERARRQRGVYVGEYGPGLGTSLMSLTLDEIQARAIQADCSSMYVECEIYHANKNSLTMAAGVGFTLVDEAAATGAQTWALSLALN